MRLQTLPVGNFVLGKCAYSRADLTDARSIRREGFLSVSMIRKTICADPNFIQKQITHFLIIKNQTT